MKMKREIPSEVSDEVDDTILCERILSECNVPKSDWDSVMTRERGHVVRLQFKSLFQLRFLPSDISKLHYLRELGIFWCKNIKTLPNEIGDLPNLTSIQISWCDRFESIPNEIANSKTLQVLSLSGCKKVQGIPSGLWDIPSLRSIRLQGCNKDCIMRMVKDDINFTHSATTATTTTTTAAAAVVAAAATVTNLDLIHNDLTTNDLSQLWPWIANSFPYLKRLDLSGNKISSLVLRGMDVSQQPLPRLQCLVLRSNPVVDRCNKKDQHSMERILNSNRLLGMVCLGGSSSSLSSSSSCSYPNCRPSRLHTTMIQHLMDINKAGRILFFEESIPISVWPIVLERANAIFESSPTRQANALFHLLHGPAFAARNDWVHCCKRKTEKAGMYL